MTNFFLPIAAILAGWLIAIVWLSAPFGSRDLRLALSPPGEVAKGPHAVAQVANALVRDATIMTDNVRSS
jgi:hypothetical protein